MKFTKLPLPLVAFGQAFLMALYCFLVVNFINWVDNSHFGENLYGPAVMLCLLVLSAGLSAFLVFAYALYLVLDKRFKEALIVVGYTFLFLLLLIILLFLLVV